jgi:hypothetical protein
MAERWVAKIRYRPGAGYPDNSFKFEELTNFGALAEMMPNQDEIESITITPNRPSFEKAPGQAPQWSGDIGGS